MIRKYRNSPITLYIQTISMFIECHMRILKWKIRLRLFEAREGMIKLVSVHCGIILALTHIGRRVSW